AEVDGLQVSSLPQAPEMEPMTILVSKKIFWNDSVLELRRQPPFARHHVVTRQVPPEVIMQLLRTAIHLPAPGNPERLAVHDKAARRSVRAVLSPPAERAHVDASRAAMDGVRTRVTSFLEHLLRLDNLVNCRLGGIGLGINDVDSRRANPG